MHAEPWSTQKNTWNRVKNGGGPWNKGKFLLTINDHEKVREWYEEFNIKEVEVNYSVSRAAEGRGKYRELIITNY